MSDQKIKIEQGVFDDAFRVKWTGGRSILITGAVFAIMMAMFGIGSSLIKSNELRKQQLEQAKRQYTLDSLRFEYLKQQKTK